MVAEDAVTAGALALAKRNNASSHEPFMGISRAVLEAALSAAEPVAFTSQGQIAAARNGSTALLYGKRDEFMNVPLYAAPPAPSVAVKALEWKRNGWVEAFSQPDGLGVWYSISPRNPVHGPGEAPFSCRVIWSVPNQTEGRYLGEDFQSVEEAKAAAQSDYEARIHSALSAQVQDVAGWQLVPTQPTEEMLDAYWVQTGESELMRSRVHTRAKTHYEAMIAAAPERQEVDNAD